jgi:hypothetical protein
LLDSFTFYLLGAFIMNEKFYSVFINLNSNEPDFEENAYYLTLKEAQNLAAWCKDEGYKTAIVEMSRLIN